MSFKKPSAALAAGCLLLVSAAALAQSQTDGRAQPADPAVQTLVLQELARVDWIEKSDVAALREGVIERMELQIGMPVQAGGTIGVLHHEMADLTVKKNDLQARQVAPKEKAEAQFFVAASKVARDKRLNGRTGNLVSAEEVAEHEGEMRVADAARKEADENHEIAKAELDLAVQTMKEHTIVAPFDGIIIKRMKNPGESVRANEAVVSLGNPHKLVANAYVPLEYSYRVKEGQVVEIQPRITEGRGAPLPIEKKRFRGKITFVDPQIQPVAETAVRIRAEFENPDSELRPGLLVQMTIFMTPDAAAAATTNAAPVDQATRTARAQ
jgi:RND family efflux transporter MFP subunit